MPDYNRRSVLRGIGAVGTASVVGVGTVAADDGDDGDGDAKLRAAHAVPDAPAVDIYVGVSPSGNDPTVGGLEFGDVTGYLELAAGEYDVTVTVAGNDTPVGPTPVTVDLAAEDYTAAATGNLNPEGDEDGFGLELFQDKLGVLDDGEGRVRVYHLSPDAGPVDVTASPVGGDVELTIADGLTFENAGPNFDVAAGDYEVTVTALANDQNVFSGTVTVNEGQVLSVLAEGEAFPDDGDAGFGPVLAYEDAAPFGGGRGGDDEEEDDEEEEDEEDD